MRIKPLCHLSGQCSHCEEAFDSTQYFSECNRAKRETPASSCLLKRYLSYLLPCVDAKPERIKVVEGDITRQTVDAIVNAANTTLLGGGGVDGAIHRAAGPELLAECRTLGGCPTGEARITRGYKLLARWVIHTVGPVWRDGTRGEDELLANCYRSCFELAKQKGIRTMAFPSISTGAYGFPMERAARIAVRETRLALERIPSLEKVLLVCFGRGAFEIHAEAVRSK